MVSVLEAVGSFIVGTGARIVVALLAGLALVAPAVLIAYAWRAFTAHARTANGTRPDTHFAPGHTWVAPWRRNTVAVGLDEVAERILPSATALDLPARGMEVHRGDPIAVIRAGRRAIRISAPVDGTIVGVNHRARRNPALVKEDPYGRGWLFAIAPRNDAWKELPSGPAGDLWVSAERRRLARFVEDELGLAAADGGELVAPAPALLGEDAWRRLLSAFFLHAA
jgi:glycine cleavage system H lipoate-binding protein